MITYPSIEAIQQGASPCPHGAASWFDDDCPRCGCETAYCPWCPFFRCRACAKVLPRPMPGEETYPFFPPGHLSAEQCWEIWMSYNAVNADDIATSVRLPLATQQQLWPLMVRGILIFFHRFGFTWTHVEDLARALAQECQRQAQEATT